MSEKPVKTDMRWIRTERHLLRAFGEAIETTPIEKITVTGIARAAEVNKATFYLHYRDIFDLAQSYVDQLARDTVEELGDTSVLFSEPRRFVSTLMNALADGEKTRTTEAIAKNNLIPHYMNALIANFNDALRSVRPVPDDLRSRAALSFFLHGVMGTLAQMHDDDDREELTEIIGDLVEVLMEHGNALAASETVRSLSTLPK